MTEQKTEQKIEAFWRAATAEDIAKVMRGEKVEARVRDEDNQDWKFSRLMGFYDTKPFPWLTVDGAFGQCQVYDPPQWWIDKPDPGEGYRLLASGEKLLEGDQFFNSVGDWVGACLTWSGGFVQDGLFYRRRIEPEGDPGGDWEPTSEEVQYAMDACRVPTIKVCDVVGVAGQSPVATNNEFRKFVDKAQAGELSFTCSFVWEGPEAIKVKVGDRIQHPNGCCIDITETGFKVNATLDTVEFGK